MRSFWILLASAIVGGIVLTALGASGRWWSPLFVFAFVFAGLKLYGLRSWWHAGLGMGLSALFLPPVAGEGRSLTGLAIMAGGVLLALVCAYVIQRKHLLRGAAALALVLGTAVSISAQQPQGADAWNRTWRFKHAHSSGKASLGGILQITLRPNRLVLVRPNANGDTVTWSCPTNGAPCTNDPLDGTPATTSYVHAAPDRLTIVTRAIEKPGRAFDVRRILHVNGRGELIVETASSDGDRFRGRSVYHAYRRH